MSYYQGMCAHNDIYSNRPTLGQFDGDSREIALNDGLDYNPEYNKEVNQLLNEVKGKFLSNNLGISRKNYDFSKDIHHALSIPYWYEEMLQFKINETKRRLQSLSNVVSNICPSTGAQIKSIERDHNVIFCKMDCPRYPTLDEPWTNSWKFDCTIKCKEIDKPNHIHMDNCENHILLEHSDTRVSTATSNISHMEYPEYVMDAVKLFQDFASETTKNKLLSDSVDAHNTVFEKFMWTTIELIVRSNYLNQMMLIIRGKKIALLTPELQKYFESGPGKNSNVISVLCIDENRSKNKKNKPMKLTSISELNDQVGPIFVQYDAKTDNSFNSVEIIQLGKLVENYAGLTEEITLLDISCCNCGILSFMLSHKCEKVIGLTMEELINLKISQIEKLRVLNNIHNVAFIDCNPKDLLTGCSPLIEQFGTVAVLNLSSPYGKSRQVMQALRDIPSILRIIVYGSFTSDFHGYISILTSKDDSVEECYLPVRSCILDKLPTAKSAFDIAIVFERNSLVTPKLEPPSPTSDSKSHLETYDHDSLDMQENLQRPRDEQLLSDPCLYNCPTPIQDEYPSPPPPFPLPMESNLLHMSKIKIENEGKKIHCIQKIMEYPEITSYFKKFSEVNHCVNLALPKTVKSELADCCGSSSEVCNNNNEPVDMEISPNTKDTKGIETPIHNLRVNNTILQSPPPPVFTSITTLDGFEFTVQANKSYLNMKRGPEQLNAAKNVKKKLEKDESDDEVQIIDEKKSEQGNVSKPRIRVKTVDELMKVGSVFEKKDDLRILYEKRKKILEQLNEKKEMNCHKDSHGRSSTSDLPRSYKRQSSSSTSRSSRKHNRLHSPCKRRSPSSKRR